VIGGGAIGTESRPSLTNGRRQRGDGARIGGGGTLAPVDAVAARGGLSWERVDAIDLDRPRWGFFMGRTCKSCLGQQKQRGRAMQMLSQEARGRTEHVAKVWVNLRRGAELRGGM
jgi:hypothetical protein